jgi:hypothetical protein
VCIFGSRKFPRLEMVDDYVDTLPPGTVLIVGGAPGVDLRAETRAIKRGLAYERYDADWDKHGKAAGFMRNTTMMEKSTRGVGFWDGHSRGTLDTIKKFKDAGKPCVVITRLKSGLIFTAE